MDDQFGGRTDDDLFYDDFEPVDSAPIVVADTPSTVQSMLTTPPTMTAPSVQPDRPPVAPRSKPNGLASSRFANQPDTPPAAAKTKNSGGGRNRAKASIPDSSSPAPASASMPSSAPQSETDTPAATSSPPSTTKPARPAGQPAPAPAPAPATGAAPPSSRLRSGANPRQKPTDTELAAKMARMKLLAAEQTRKFEMAEKDQKQHEQAYARGMEDARKRRAEEAERRRRGEEDRRRLDDERAKNRERKLKAMSMKEGGWDEGKDAQAAEEGSRRAFRGANGSIRGTRSPAGLAGSRYHAVDGGEQQQQQHDVDRFLEERPRGRGRGRGGRGGAGRGRGGGGTPPSTSTKAQEAAPSLTKDEFPSLPLGTQKPAVDEKGPAIAAMPELPKLPAIGKWDDEVEAMEELKNKQL
ncbi:hypothetical protein DCS_02222 [Drechmeria coniospora]|uniref:Uncharacterized protein n=1 Tax=Drechmeria coniospora TaxID=98403 RepID=A0A151GVI2_DRECN|nr:hypothetical protein DCS_02222 [Drechmeria coniospora]KYK61081.1 hypothetical protein DCS_02222 [Drechmeria coniospora]ODA80847.1 hypothetical protein RJ55_03807 [Drechmeria coniospora]